MIALTEVGIDTKVREVQERKAYWPMTVTEVGMETEEREVQDRKA